MHRDFLLRADPKNHGFIMHVSAQPRLPSRNASDLETYSASKGALCPVFQINSLLNYRKNPHIRVLRHMFPRMNSLRSSRLVNSADRQHPASHRDDPPSSRQIQHQASKEERFLPFLLQIPLHRSSISYSLFPFHFSPHAPPSPSATSTPTHYTAPATPSPPPPHTSP